MGPGTEPPFGIKRLPEHQILPHIKTVKEWLKSQEERYGRGAYKLNATRYGKVNRDIHPKGRKEDLTRQEIAHAATILYNLLSYWPRMGDRRWKVVASEGIHFTIKFSLLLREYEDDGRKKR